MTVPVSDDGAFWVQFSVAIVTVGGSMFGTVRWLLAKIEAVRIGNDQAIDRLRSEMVNKLDAHVREYREDREKAQAWREEARVTMASVVTRTELERQLDRQSENLLQRLDVRVQPLLEERRRARVSD